MSSGKVAKSCFAVALLCAVAAAQDRDRILEDFTEAVSDAISDAEVLRTNGFLIESSQVNELGADLEPDGNQFRVMSVTASGMFKVGIETGRPSMSRGGGVGVFHRESGVPMLAFGDKDGDGRIDVLEYTVLDENGESALSVVDYELDGQPDLRVHLKEGYFEIWHIDRWYRVEERNDRRGIAIGNEFIELQRGDDRWIVP